MKKKIIVILVCIILLMPLKVNATRGCCSHHGGVSGCSSSGRLVCNDGTLSPSCTCTPTVTYTYGCTDKNASNYNSSANRDDGSCIISTSKNIEDEKDSNSLLNTILGIGVISGGVYLYKRKHK